MNPGYDLFEQDQLPGAIMVFPAFGQRLDAATELFPGNLPVLPRFAELPNFSRCC